MTAVDAPSVLADLNDRSRSIFQLLVKDYLDNGEPVGSRTLADRLAENRQSLSAASVRNVLQDLQELGLLSSPHISAGRIPTESGLRLFVDSLMEIEDASEAEQKQIHDKLTSPQSREMSLLDEASSLLSCLSGCASIVFAPKLDKSLRQIEFVRLNRTTALAVFVFKDGSVENRLFKPPANIDDSALKEAANFLNRVVAGLTITQAQKEAKRRLNAARSELNRQAQELIDMGRAFWSKADESTESRLIIRGSALLLNDAKNNEDLAVIQALFEDIERESELASLLKSAAEGEGVRIFIGSESKLFSLTSSSLVVSPYINSERKLLGMIGVVGPTRLNYGRIVPVVEYTAQLVGKLISERRLENI